MINAGTHGAVTWSDLTTPDIDSAVSFYRDLLDWTDVVEQVTSMGTYFVGKAGEHEACGMMAQGEEIAGMAAMWTVYIYTNDVDETAAKIAKAGGAVLTPPFDIPDARIAIVADPTGAMFGLFGGPDIQGEFYSMAPGGVCWADLLSRDPAAAGGFYDDVFGWKAVSETVDWTEYMVFTLGGEMVSGMVMMPDMVPAEVPSHWGVYFTVDDCDAAVAKATRLGGQVIRPTTTIETGKFAVLADPQGATFDVMET